MFIMFQGQNLQVFESVDELSVIVGNEVCTLMDVSNQLISCKPPAKLNKEVLDKDGNAEIKVICTRSLINFVSFPRVVR